MGYVGRLAPSPTGLIHVGIARTSLLAWLDAR
ncbi:MAG: glutamate--tRNA ligase family protein, partial [Myxococcota bacterium]